MSREVVIGSGVTTAVVVVTIEADAGAAAIPMATVGSRIRLDSSVTIAVPAGAGARGVRAASGLENGEAAAGSAELTATAVRVLTVGDVPTSQLLGVISAMLWVSVGRGAAIGIDPGGTVTIGARDTTTAVGNATGRTVDGARIRAAGIAATVSATIVDRVETGPFGLADPTARTGPVASTKRTDRGANARPGPGSGRKTPIRCGRRFPNGWTPPN